MRVFVANRGEIAVRIVRACHELGHEAVVGASEVDMAKLIGHGEDRDAAIETVREALDGLEVDGVETNRSLLLSVLTHPDFVEGRVTTRWLEEALV